MSPHLPDPPLAGENPLGKTTECIVAGIERRLHLGVQVYVSHRALPVAQFTLGWNRANEPLSPEHLMPWLSSGKPLTALLILKLIEAGALTLDQPVASLIPEFAQQKKESVTLRHLLTHTSGMERVATGWPKQPWNEIVRRLCAAPLKERWQPGQRAAYDPVGAWFILGEIARRIDGRPVERLLREEICLPLGMTRSWMALPPDLYAQEPIGVLYNRDQETFVPTQGHTVEFCTAPSPGGSMRGPMAELGLFYEMLLRRGATANGWRLVHPDTVDLMTTRHRIGLYDETFQHTIDFGLGVIVDSNRYGKETVPYGFGRYCSEATFGHGGAQSSIAFGDPQHQLVVAIVANGCPGEPRHNRRFREIISAVYEDLGLAGEA